MASTDSILKIVLSGVFAGNTANPILNTFFYRVGATSQPNVLINNDAAEAIWDGFKTAFMTSLLSITHSAMRYNGLRVDDYTDPAHPFGDYGFLDGQGGYGANGSLPAFNAWGFELQRTNRTTKAGSKRFCGVPEDYQLNGVQEGASTQLLAVAVGLDTVVDCITDSGVEFSLVPIIARPATSGMSILAWQPVSGAVYKRITTQNTRKT